MEAYGNLTNLHKNVVSILDLPKKRKSFKFLISDLSVFTVYNI